MRPSGALAPVEVVGVVDDADLAVAVAIANVEVDVGSASL
jgi:hypothetical protein